MSVEKMKKDIDEDKLVKIGFDLLESASKKADIHSDERFNEENIKGARLVVALFNGVNKARQTQVSIYRLTDYHDKIAILKSIK